VVKLGFNGGGGGGTLSNHTHDPAVTNDGGALASNKTSFGLTNGSLLYSDGTNIEELTPGTTGQSLKMGASIPAWGSAGAWEKLDYVTGSGATVETNTFSAKDLLQVMIYGKSGGGTKAGTIQFGNSGTFTTSGYSYNRQNANVFETATGQGSIIINPDTTVDADLWCVFWIINEDGADKIMLSPENGLSINVFGRLCGISNQSNQITDIKILANIHGGTGPTWGTGTKIEVYGRNWDD
jgi:hypothetical protein